MQSWSRRSFLKNVPRTAAALAALRALDDSRRAFAASLAELPASPQGGAFAGLRDQYSLSEGIVYFNHGSIGTIPKSVQEARSRYLSLCETDPWFYMWEGDWDKPREETRRKAAKLLGARPDEVAITHNTTEGFNVLAAGLPLGPGDEVVFSSLNHPGASICWEHYGANRGYSVKRFEFPLEEVPRLTKQDVVDIYSREIGRSTRALIFPFVDNMVGLRHPIRELTAMARSKGVHFVAVDAAQALGMLPMNVHELGVDFVAASPHKWLQAPKGLGLLYVRADIRDGLRPLWVTWGQRLWAGTGRIFEDYGTRNLPEVLALGNAIDFQDKLGAKAKEARYRQLWEYFRKKVEGSSRLIWRSPTQWEVSASLFALGVKGKSSEDLFKALWPKKGFVFRAFSGEDFDAARISPNVSNTEEEIDRFAAAAESV